jgi:hypothetical protein
MNKKLTTLVLILAALSASNTAIAGTSTGTMTTTANVSGGCSLEAPTMDFGTIDPFGGLAYTASTMLKVACTAGLAGVTIKSTSARNLIGPAPGLVEIAFGLGQDPLAALGNTLPSDAAGQAITNYTSDGTIKDVPLHGHIKAASYENKILTAGNYTAAIVLEIGY